MKKETSKSYAKTGIYANTEKESRPCLKCKEEFMSWGPGNRFCAPCRERAQDHKSYKVNFKSNYYG